MKIRFVRRFRRFAQINSIKTNAFDLRKSAQSADKTAFYLCDEPIYAGVGGDADALGMQAAVHLRALTHFFSITQMFRKKTGLLCP